MKLKDVILLLKTEQYYVNNDLLDMDIKLAAASDLMSEILACINVPDILLTGLTNPQVIRTSAVFGIKAVIIVRDRPVDKKLIDLAEEEDITLLSTKETLFNSSGILFEKGIRGVATGSCK